MKACPKCNELHNKLGKFCSRSCANSRGPRTEEFKNSVSKKLTGRSLSETTKQKISGDNHHKRKGKNFPPILEIECLYCYKKFIKIRHTQQYCCKNCWMADNKENRTEWIQYQIECRFKFNIYDYPSYFDLQLIEQYGWYSAKNRGGNLNGISRDHMISAKYGFRNNISPEILSHPANCQLMLQSENSKKKTKCSLTLEELHKKIQNFNVSLAD